MKVFIHKAEFHISVNQLAVTQATGVVAVQIQIRLFFVLHLPLVHIPVAGCTL